jgi:hypothetical protein
MEVVQYDELSELEITALCVWRESRGELLAVRRCVAWSIRNRAVKPRWWNQPRGAHPSLWHATVLKPWQYSSFNHGDPNETRWPVSDTDEGWGETRDEVNLVMTDTGPDPTDGATHYFDTSISFPKAWGIEANWLNTLNLGRVRFWKEKIINSNHHIVSGAHE